MVQEKIVLISGPRANRIEMEGDEDKIYARKTSWFTRAKVSGTSCINNQKVALDEDVKKGFASRARVPAAL